MKKRTNSHINEAYVRIGFTKRKFLHLQSNGTRIYAWKIRAIGKTNLKTHALAELRLTMQQVAVAIAQWVKRPISDRKVAGSVFDSRSGNAKLCPWERHFKFISHWGQVFYSL